VSIKELLVEFKDLGCVDISAKFNQQGREINKAEEILRCLLKTRKDAAKVLELVEPALNQMPLFVQMSIQFTGVLAIGARGNHGDCSALLNGRNQCIGVVAFVGNHMGRLPVVEQGFGLGNVADLASGQDKGQGSSQSIHQRMELAAKAASTAP
jgi:hypothetical protein